LDYNADCVIELRDGVGATVDVKTSTTGYATRNVFFSGLTAATQYGYLYYCGGAQPDTNVYSFSTKPTPAGGNRTVPISAGAPVNLSTAARATVEYDDNEAMSTPASVQNTSCSLGCTINLTIPAGQWWYRWIWQTSGDVTISSSPIIPLQVE
jgi:hypothetical protein